MAVRRMKTYTGETGYVYQYYFVGRRAALPGSAESPATEFIFDVTPDRKTMFAVSVFLKAEAVAAWKLAHGRELSETEQYGAAKMRLFRGFDQVEKLREEGRQLAIEAADIEELLAPLNLQ